MKAHLLVALALMCGHASAQATFTASLGDGDEWWGRLEFETTEDGEGIWTVVSYRRARLFWLLHRLHERSGLDYEVVWGKQDVVRLNIGPLGPREREPDRFELLLRRMLNEFEMTYRIQDGSYYVVPRPSHGTRVDETPQSAIGTFGAFNIDAKHAVSLDLLSSVLAMKGQRYRVERVGGAHIDLQGTNMTYPLFVQVLMQLDPKIEIAERGGVVVVRRARQGLR